MNKKPTHAVSGSFLIGIIFLGAICLLLTMIDGLPLLGAIMIFGVLIALAFVYPEWMLIAVVVVSILVPVDLAIKASELPRIGPTRAVLASFLVGWFLRIIVVKEIHLNLSRVPFLFYIVSFLTFSGISAIYSVAPLKSFYSIMSFAAEQFLLFYIFVYFMSVPGFWHRLKSALFLTTAVICVFAFYEEFSHYNPILHLYPQEEIAFRAGIFRARSTFFHPIALGCFINLVFPFVFIEIIQSETKVKKIVLGGLLIAMLVTSFLTVSRGPWVSLLIEILIFVGWFTGRSLQRKVVAGVIIALVAFGWFSAFYFLDPSNKLVNVLVNPNRGNLTTFDEETSEYYRIALLRAVLDSLHEARWIYGFGPGTFHLGDVESIYAGHRHTLTAADSYYIKLLFEYGVVGLSLFVILLISVLTTSLRTIHKIEESNKLLVIGCFGSILGFVLENISVSMFGLFPLGLLFWLSVAITRSLKYSD